MFRQCKIKACPLTWLDIDPQMTAMGFNDLPDQVKTNITASICYAFSIRSE
jgi:hypothetical protein